MGGGGGCSAVLTLFVAPRGEDRWFAVIDAWALEGQSERDLIANLPPDDSDAELDVGVARRAVAAFGMPWAEITDQIGYAMKGILASAPGDFANEFLRWEPEELRYMREHWIAGGSSSFFEAIRCLHAYRHHSSLDIRPPIKAGD